jgi:hypothetical protein
MFQKQVVRKELLSKGTGRVRDGLGPIGTCVCQYCGYREAHQRGIPCNQRKCPKCGIRLKRQDDNQI